jgi:tetratricopeptide (TPR) repeat protein
MLRGMMHSRILAIVTESAPETMHLNSLQKRITKFGITVTISLGAMCAAMAANDENTKSNVSSLTAQGYSCLQSAQFARALDLFTKAIETDPGSARVYSLRAMSLLGLHRYSDAAKDCDKAISLDPKLPDGYLCAHNSMSGLRNMTRRLMTVIRFFVSSPILLKRSASARVRTVLQIGLRKRYQT